MNSEFSLCVCVCVCASVLSSLRFAGEAGEIRSLEAPAKAISREWTSCLRPIDGRTLDLPTIVQSWCIRYQTDTLLSDNRQEYVDSEPLWTLGYTRPLYIERQPKCLRCKELRQPSGRFVPVEPTTPSIPSENLQRFAKILGRYDNDIKARLLDKWLPSSRNPRGG